MIKTFKIKSFLKIAPFLFLFLTIVSPMTVVAQNQGDNLYFQTTQGCDAYTGISNMLCRVHKILNSIVPVLVALGIVYFVWGVVAYFIAGGEEAKKKGKDAIIYGIIGLTVIVGFWGLVNIVVSTFDIGGQSAVVSTLAVAPTGDCNLINNPKFSDLLSYVTCVIYKSVIPLIFALAVVMFIWGVVQYVIRSDEEAKKEKGRQFMIWGIIAITVMVSVWGLVGILGDTFGIEYVIPQVKSP